MPVIKKEFSVEIIQHIGVLAVNASTNWQKELNLVSWSNHPPKLDIRDWSKDHSHYGKGITLTTDEAEKLSSLISQHIKS